MANVNYTLKTQVDISIRCRDVPVYDLLSPSDPMAVLYLVAPRNESNPTAKRLRLIGRTEVIKDDPHASFKTKIRVEYEFESVQTFCLTLYDVDDPTNLDDLSKQELIGYFEFTLASLMSAQHCTITSDLWKEKSIVEKHKKCKITLQGEEIVESRLWASGHIRAMELPKRGWFSRDNTALELVKKRPNNTENVFYTSPVVMKNQSPLYPPFEVGLSSVFQGIDDLNSEITLRVIAITDDKWKQRVIVGESTLPIQELITDHGPMHTSLQQSAATTQQQASGPDSVDSSYVKIIPLFHPTSKKAAGSLEIVSFKVEAYATFLDYIRGGLQFKLIVGIDFTSSNYIQTTGTNLHQLHSQPQHKGYSNERNSQNNSSHPTSEIPSAESQKLNQYETALQSIGSILTSYAGTTKIHALGYGAQVSVDRGPRQVNFAFPLTLTQSRCEVDNVQELMYAYRHALNNMTLSGPTYFSPIVNIAHEISKQGSPTPTSTQQQCTILLILTDGMINDMDKTIDSIVQASNTLLSIIIVGIGNADFTSMDVLDGDEDRLTSTKYGPALRDIVQFVPMRELTGHTISTLAEHTLKEIPDQVLSYFRLHKIQPLNGGQQQQHSNPSQEAYRPPS